MVYTIVGRFLWVGTKSCTKILNLVDAEMFLKKNQNAPRPSEHPPVRRKKCQNV